MTIKIKDDRVAKNILPDEKALKEAGGFEAESLEVIGNRNHFHRRERFQDCLILGALIAFWLIVAGSVVLGLVWFYHLLAPESWHYLSERQQEKIHAMLFSGLMSAAVTGSAKRYLR